MTLPQDAQDAQKRTKRTSGLSQPGMGGGAGFFCTAFTRAVNLAEKACRAAALAIGTSGTARKDTKHSQKKLTLRTKGIRE